MIRWRAWIGVLLVIGLLTVPAWATISASRVTVTTSATSIVAAGSDTIGACVRNAGTASVYLGGSGVTTSTGYELPASDTLCMDLLNNETLYGIVASGTVEVHLVKNRVTP